MNFLNLQQAITVFSVLRNLRHLIPLFLAWLEWRLFYIHRSLCETEYATPSLWHSGRLPGHHLSPGATWEQLIILEQSDGKLLWRAGSQRTGPCESTALLLLSSLSNYKLEARGQYHRLNGEEVRGRRTCWCLFGHVSLLRPLLSSHGWICFPTCLRMFISSVEYK